MEINALNCCLVQTKVKYLRLKRFISTLGTAHIAEAQNQHWRVFMVQTQHKWREKKNLVMFVALATITFACGPTSELFNGFGASAPLHAEVAVSDGLADSGWSAHAHHRSRVTARSGGPCRPSSNTETHVP